jgi:xanthine/uracil permease
METWGDTQASMEASRLDTSGQPLQIMRQKGALLNDTLSGILAALSGVLPLTTFAQNNGACMRKRVRIIMRLQGADALTCMQASSR